MTRVAEHPTVALPARSAVYHLKPINVDSPLIESFISYVSRLAQAHCLTLGRFLVITVAPQLGDRALSSLGVWSSRGHELNGIGRFAERCVHAMEQLTKHQNLQGLTLLPWRNFLSMRGLLRKTRAWCQVCFDDWRRRGLEIYQPLLWACEDVTFCGIHNARLMHRCPNPFCHDVMSAFDNRFRPGFCTECGDGLAVKCMSGSM